MKGRINIGTASIILIFIILCLSVFSLLSLSDAKSAEIFAQRRADSVKTYYDTDRKGQLLVKSASEALKEHQNASLAAASLKNNLSDGAFAYPDETGNLILELPMVSGQSLYIKLDGKTALVLSYYVYISEDYAIDTELPVWTGNE